MDQHISRDGIMTGTADLLNIPLPLERGSIPVWIFTMAGKAVTLAPVRVNGLGLYIKVIYRREQLKRPFCAGMFIVAGDTVYRRAALQYPPFFHLLFEGGKTIGKGVNRMLSTLIMAGAAKSVYIGIKKCARLFLPPAMTIDTSFLGRGVGINSQRDAFPDFY